MCRVVKIDITENAEELQTLLKKQHSASLKERILALYLLQTKQVETVQHLAVILGRGRITVQRWLRQYREGGLKTLLEVKTSTGRKPIINSAVREKIVQELSDPQGFSSYGEIQTWLQTVMGVEASYKVVHDTVRYQLKAKLKVPRPRSKKHSVLEEETFKKNYQSS
jgi:transposase